MAAGIDAKEAAHCEAFSPQGVRFVHHHSAAHGTQRLKGSPLNGTSAMSSELMSGP